MCINISEMNKQSLRSSQFLLQDVRFDLTTPRKNLETKNKNKNPRKHQRTYIHRYIDSKRRQ